LPLERAVGAQDVAGEVLHWDTAGMIDPKEFDRKDIARTVLLLMRMEDVSDSEAVEIIAGLRRTIFAGLKDVKFEQAEKCNDWRNYVSSPVREVWHDLSHETRMTIWFNAGEFAENESRDSGE
jgi:hypothetical protein